MANDITDTNTIGRNFAMLSNLAVLQGMEKRHNPRNLSKLELIFDRDNNAASLAFGTAKELTDAYAVKFLASGAHLKLSPNSHALPDDVRKAAQPLETFLDAQYRLKTGFPPSVSQRQEMLGFLNEYTNDKNEFAYPGTFAREERQQLNAILPEHDDHSMAGLLIKLRDKTEGAMKPEYLINAGLGRQGIADCERERKITDEDDFLKLPAMIEDFRRAMNEHLEDKGPLFDPRYNDNVAAHDPQAHGPHIDFDAVRTDAALRRQAIDGLKQEIIAARDPLIEETAQKIAADRPLSAGRLAKELAGPDAGISSSSSENLSVGPMDPSAMKRPHMEERPRKSSLER
jgi:hypothetical protein